MTVRGDRAGAVALLDLPFVERMRGASPWRPETICSVVQTAMKARQAGSHNRGPTRMFRQADRADGEHASQNHRQGDDEDAPSRPGSPTR